MQALPLCSRLAWAFNVTLPCEVTGRPNVTFEIGGRAWPLTVQDYAYQVGAGVVGGRGVVCVSGRGPCGMLRQMSDGSTIIATARLTSAAARCGVCLQSPRSLRCFSAISAIGGLGPGAWVLGSTFLHSLYSVYEYGSGAGGGGGGPRVGLASLTAKEVKAAAALYERQLSAKTGRGGVFQSSACLTGGGGGGGCGSSSPLLQTLFAAAVAMTAASFLGF